MYKIRERSAVLCIAIFMVLGMWGMLSAHCLAVETNNDEHSRRPSVSVPLRILSIMLIKTVSDEAMATNFYRLWQVIPDGNSSM